MRVKVIRAYKDKQLGRMTAVGEILDVVPERAALLVEIGYAQKHKKENATCPTQSSEL